jgi:hypothetical protein
MRELEVREEKIDKKVLLRTKHFLMTAIQK